MRTRPTTATTRPTLSGRTPAGDHPIQIPFKGEVSTMSHTTFQPETPAPAPAAFTGAQARLWTALTQMPGATAAELATAAGIGRSTAGKTLAALEKTGMTR